LTGKTRTASKETSTVELSDAAVRDYLKDHPDFFEHHPDMLDQLHISHSSGSAVSLVEKQVSVLRERNMEMRKRLNSLTGNARDNDRLYDLTRKLVLSLLESANLEELGKSFITGLQDDFGVEHASLVLFGDPEQSTTHCRIDSADRARIEIGALIKGQNALCGTLRPEELRYLFPSAGNVGSAAVVPLAKGGDLGVIAVGSEDPNHYSASMGTLFLNHLGEVLVRLLPRLSGDSSRE
jgi:uncharacterized protein YigA (DUF484 family)